MITRQSTKRLRKDEEKRSLIRNIKMPFEHDLPNDMVKVVLPRSPFEAIQADEVLPTPQKDDAYSFSDMLGMTVEELRDLRMKIFDLSREMDRLMSVALWPLSWREEDGFFADGGDHYLAQEWPPVPLFYEQHAEAWRTWNMLLLLISLKS